MNAQIFNHPLDLHRIKVQDPFWSREQDLVTDKVLPYQWNALNDQIPDTTPSYCMHNFRAAAALMQKKHAGTGENGRPFVAPSYTYRGFEALPEDPAHPDPERFYGFVFQDTDFSKWIEAVGYSLIRRPDPELEKLADGAIDIVCAAQDDTGYLDTYYILNGMDRSFTNLKDHHELYCLGHLVEGAISYYEATGKDKLLQAARRFADYCYECFGSAAGKKKGYPGHEIAEMALLRLYELTGEERYKELAGFFLDQRGTKPLYFREEELEQASHDGRTFTPPENGSNPTFFEAVPYSYYQAHMPVREQTEAVGHAVRAVYLYSGMADAARLTGDEKMLSACENLWNNIVDEKLYITGGIGATHFGESFSYGYDLPNDTAYSESCAAIGLVFFARRMLQICPDRKYADVMEQALYNTVMAGMDLTGTRFFYVNPLEANPLASRRDEHKHHVRTTRQKWFGCACCPPNIARILSSLASYAYTENDTTLWNHLYLGSRIEKTLTDTDGTTHTLIQETKGSFPWSGDVTVTATGDGTKATLAFRIPSWSHTTSIRVSQGEQSISLTLDRKETSRSWPVMEAADAPRALTFSYESGYFYITGPIRDVNLSLTMDMTPRLVRASNKVSEDAGKVALLRGPLVYCLEETDNGKDLHLLSLEAGQIRPQGNEDALCGLSQHTTDAFGYEVPLITLPGIRKKPENQSLYLSAFEKEETEPVTLTFVPYYLWNNRGEGEMSVWVRLS